MLINSAADFYSALLQGSYAWPGGYPTYWIMADGEALMFNVAFTEAKLMLDALTHPEYRDDQWRPVALEINWEDPDLICCHTNERIESAYAD